MRLIARAARVFQFLTRCASSTITNSGAHQVQVAAQLLVVGDQAERIAFQQRAPRLAAALDHLRLAPGETRDLALPLILERGRADHQHPAHAEMAGQDLGRGDRLDGLAQAHVVADQRAPGSHREQRALGLVGVERHFDQPGQRRAGRALRERLGQHGAAAFGIVHAGQVIARRVVDAQCMAVPAADVGETLQRRSVPGIEQPTIGSVIGRRREQPARLRQHRVRRLAAQLQAQAARMPRLHPHFAIGRPESLPERRLGAALAFQPRQHEFHVLAGAQLVGAEVRAVALVLARRQAADQHAVGAAGVRVAHAELGEQWLGREIVQHERLLAPELAPQRALPVLRRHVHGRRVRRQARLDLIAGLAAGLGLAARLAGGAAAGGLGSEVAAAMRHVMQDSV
ncbi:MAG: hypothetical protein QM581_03790 [Pseudomonas sp.]